MPLQVKLLQAKCEQHQHESIFALYCIAAGCLLH
jgi:hypothetical protein